MFRYAIFLNAVNVLSPSEGLGKELAETDMRKTLETFDGGAYSQGEGSIESVRIMSSDVMSAAIAIPTLHVIGLKDGFRDFSRDLVKQCTPSNARVVNLSTGHEVPKGRGLETVALEIEEALATVSLAA